MTSSGRAESAPSADFHDVVAVLMAGGAGTRLWPLSTADMPKQFATDLADRSLYAQAYDRARSLVPPDRILVMTSVDFVDLVRRQTPEMPAGNIILEPLRRDTGPAMTLAGLVAGRQGPETVMAVFPSDHFVGDLGAFRQTLALAVARARRGGLGTIGIRPTRAATEFGYLQVAEPPDPLAPQRVERFVEKPDQRKAEQFLASGRYLWNAGIFVWQARALLEAAERHMPKTYRLLADVAEWVGTAEFAERAAETFGRISPVSIDFGVMEKAEDVWCLPAGFDWDDVGGWVAAGRFLPADECGNRTRGSVFLEEVTGAVVVGPAGHPVAVVGLSDVVVVHSEAGTLVCHKSAVEQLRPLVKRIVES